MMLGLNRSLALAPFGPKVLSASGRPTCNRLTASRVGDGGRGSRILAAEVCS
jgi:hypothetical protein